MFLVPGKISLYRNIQSTEARYMEVPHNLTEHQKEERVRKETLNLLNDGGYRIISKIVTGDEAYIPFCDVPTLQESKVWIFEDDPTPTMVKRQRAMKKVFFRSTELVKAIKLEGQKRVTANCCQVIYSQFGLVIHQNDHQARRRFVEWAQNEIAVVSDFHKRILFSDEAHFWLNGYVNKQNRCIWSEANPQVYVETPFHPEKLTVWCALWAGEILLQKR
ncbi:uncharacterized protein TNCV_4940191 [Trichonephila clavipes]|nr:uncharacterized protein TNCV_4940191 [Trichonephila clavipes]